MNTVLVCPIVWNTPDGQAVAVFQERYRARAEAIAKKAPSPPEGGWKLFPMIGLELLAFLREQHANGVTLLLLDPETNLAGYAVDLADLLAKGKTLELFRNLAAITTGEPPEAGAVE